MPHQTLKTRLREALAGVFVCAVALPGLALAQAAATAPAPAVQAAPAPDTSPVRIILVEWRIKKGREQEFLDYWSTRSTVPDRSGLIGEFLNRVESTEQYPWIAWNLDARWTTYVTTGLWRSGADFQEQFGRFINDSRPPFDFEEERRRRVLVAPERWRIGMTPFVSGDHPGVR